MSKLRIWGRITSINVRKCVLAAQELALDFERVDAGGPFGIVRTPNYLARNPNALVPSLEDGAFWLWESNVIVRYLCAKHSPGHLYPQALEQRFNAERWMDWQQTTFSPAGRDAFVQIIRKPGGQTDMQKVEQSIAATEPLLDLLDAHLGAHSFVAGESFTMADIPLACEIHRWSNLPTASGANTLHRSNLRRWYSAILQRPATKGVLDLPLA